MVILMLNLGTKTYRQLKESNFEWNYITSPTGSNELHFTLAEGKAGFFLDFGRLNVENNFSYTYLQVDYPLAPGFATKGINSFQIIANKIELRYKLSDKWELQTFLSPSIASTLKKGLTSEDFLLAGGAYIKKQGGSSQNPSSFKLGAAYETFFGKPEIYPIVSYYKEFTEEFSAEIGFPSSTLEFTPTSKSGLSANLIFTGENMNLSKPLNLVFQDQVNKVEFSTTSLGVNYRYELDDSWSFNIGGGYLLNNEYNLLNEKDHEVYSFKMNSRPFFNTGIKFNLKNKSNRK